MTEVTEAVYRLAKAAREGRPAFEEIRLAPVVPEAGAVLSESLRAAA